MSDVTSSFICPITHEIMTDPVIDPDGNSYERSAIENWLTQHSTSPITRTPVTRNDLRPNRALRASIEEYHHKQLEENNPSTVTTTILRNSSTNTVNNQSLELTMTSSWSNGYTNISIRPLDGVGVRAPCDICCVVDTSGSMSNEVEIQGASDKERFGLSQLDLVKHALKTIIHSLTQNDRLSIVSFSNNATILFRLRRMDDDGRSSALAALERLIDDGQTNIWDGLRTGLDILSEDKRPSGSNVALFLLTDGCPNVEPPRGHLPTLVAYKTKTNFTCSINTFGFGYNLDSKLLEDLAQIGNVGSYAFIPDGSFVGTIFVNAISNLLTTAATNLKLTVRNITPAIDQTSNYVCNYSTEISNEKRSSFQRLFYGSDTYACFNLGSVIFGQSKDIIIPMEEDQYKNMKILLDYESPYGVKSRQCKSITHVPADLKIINQQRHRLEFVQYIRHGYEILRGGLLQFNDHQKEVLDNLQFLEETIQQHTAGAQYETDLLADLTGQVKQAFSRFDWFKKWGIHYLPSITRAHLLQQCNNFKDPGVQHYGQGELFNSVRDEMDAVFCSLPAPKRAHSGTAIDMSAFNDSNNPCFHGSCTVRLFDGTIKLLKHLQRGDRLYPHGATVNYVLRTICNNAQAQFVLLDGGLMVTPWHPIRLDGVHWIFPCSLVSFLTTIPCEAVYSFALSDEGHTMWINDIECVTLGHGLQDDTVRHRYYGSERVMEDLRVLDGEQKCNGMVEIEPSWIMRNKRAGMVSRIRSPLVLNLLAD